MLGNAPLAKAPLAASANESYSLSAVNGTFTLSMQGAGQLITDVYPSGQFTLNGQTIGFREEYAYPILHGSFTYAFQTFSVALGKGLFANQGSFVTTGNAVNFQRNVKIDAQTGTFSLTGQAQTHRIAVSISPPTATFSLTGFDVIFGFDIDAETKTFSYTGQSVDLSAGRFLRPVTENFSYSGPETKFRGWFTPFVAAEIWTDAA